MREAPAIVRRIREREAKTYRRVRLAALADSPSAFASTVYRESALTLVDWEDRCRTSCDGYVRAAFFAKAGDQIVGLVGGYRPDPAAPAVELISMWTDPAVRREGIGRRLVDAVIEWARAGGAETIMLWVTRANTPAENLYRSMGFVTTGNYQPLPSDPCKGETRLILVL